MKPRRFPRKPITNRKPKGCGSPTCKPCLSLPGDGPWCMCCGKTTRFVASDGPWTSDVCPECEIWLLAQDTG